MTDYPNSRRADGDHGGRGRHHRPGRRRGGERREQPDARRRGRRRGDPPRRRSGRPRGLQEAVPRRPCHRRRRLDDGGRHAGPVGDPRGRAQPRAPARPTAACSPRATGARSRSPTSSAPGASPSRWSARVSTAGRSTTRSPLRWRRSAAPRPRSRRRGWWRSAGRRTTRSGPPWLGDRARRDHTVSTARPPRVRRARRRSRCTR